ncbi:sulfate ABC transporter substrate-binding protein [Cohnella cholangitidis]|uniref:Sulfate ABC transporter substrate-binding protein n=1 Tax=Cohnella cholangitidis TaxID=2598458 RepID=A0A7G5BWN0_9BACL|nr:sulfate ABC transporter substrate-binding protein [Cohnella cholangitidis]QMV41364.1 sulfate ABC transporter substrate-binding protein [Cohnella cholangitidis]
MHKRNSTRTRATLIGLLALMMILILITACSGNKENEVNEEETPKSDYSKSVALINAVSDDTAEAYKEIDQAFIASWKDRTGQSITIEQSTGSSNAQKDSIIGGRLKADITTLGVGIDIDELQAKGFVGEGWQQRYDYNSSPFSTAVAFVVRSGNPKAIAEWEDLLQPDAQIVTSNPTTDSDARWYYAAPWAYSLDKQIDDTDAAKAFVTDFHQHVTVLAANDKEAEAVFVDQGKGDVWVTTESNALRIANTSGKGIIEVVVPSVTLTVEPIVSAVDSNADAKGAREAANAYADYLFTEEAQTIAAKHFFRPRFASILEQFPGVYADVTLLTVDDNLTGWEDLQQALFADGGLFGQLPAK